MVVNKGSRDSVVSVSAGSPRNKSTWSRITADFVFEPEPLSVESLAPYLSMPALPTFYSSTIYEGGNNSHLYAYAIPTRNSRHRAAITLKWNLRLLPFADLSQNTPVLAEDGTIYAVGSATTGGEGYLYIVKEDRADNTSAYLMKTVLLNASGIDKPPVIDGANNIIYVLAKDNELFAIDAFTGSILWRYVNEFLDKTVAPVVLPNGNVIIGSYNDHTIFADPNIVVALVGGRV